MRKATKTDTRACAICKNPFEGFGHNPQPVAEGRCCSLCNDFVVVPERIRKATRPTGVSNETVVTLRDTVILRASKTSVWLSHGGFITMMTARHMNNWLVRLGIDYRVSRRAGRMFAYSIVNPDETAEIKPEGLTLSLKGAKK